MANSTSGFDGSFDGILGIGPADLTEGTFLSLIFSASSSCFLLGTVSGSDDAVPTVSDNLKSQGVIGVEALGMFFPPYAEKASGSISFGGPDSSKYTGELSYVPITKSSPASDYWGVDQTITYAGNVISNTSSGIVDSGTTMILLASGTLRQLDLAY